MYVFPFVCKVIAFARFRPGHHICKVSNRLTLFRLSNVFSYTFCTDGFTYTLPTTRVHILNSDFEFREFLYHCRLVDVNLSLAMVCL